ncbi:MAG: efflux RND transporter permease subunit [Planctomycetota bacterium]|jgi:HAE1 family hydrophobic/amphiphilic exporter-1|nr:efflux RND transporter permease subunit [Planctomycetota bacterium]
MFLSNASVARPVAMSCLIIALSALGFNAFRKLGLELMPKMDIPFVTVQVIYPGATPSDIEVDVVKRVEDVVASVEGLKHMNSSCLENMGLVVLEFTLETDVDVAANDVRQKVDSILNDFPAGVDPPVILKVDINALPIITLALTGTLTIEELYDYADQELSDRLSSIAGVANLNLIGGADREVHVVLDREKVSAAGLSSLDVVNALQEGVLTLPAGRVDDMSYEYNVRFDAEYKAERDIGNLQVAGRDGARRYIRDLGHVEFASDEIRQASFINGRPAIGIQVVKRADANAVEVVHEVKRQLGQINQLLPGGMELIFVSDDAAFIEASYSSTLENVWQGVVLTAIILFLFLFNIRTTIVVAISMPLTIIISLFAVQLSGFTLNAVVLQALGLSVGTLVTNSIVVMESIAAQLENGAPPWKAAKDGANDVAVAVLASAGTNMVVLLPIGLMGSMVGMAFRPFAMTTLYCNTVSLFISFTLTPILCGVILKPRDDKSLLTRIGDRTNGFIDFAAKRVAHVMRFLGRHRIAGGLVVLASAALLVQSVMMTGDIGFAMFPEIDKGQLIVKLEYPTQQNLGATMEKVKEVEGVIRGAVPDLIHLFTSVGRVNAADGSPSEGTFLASIYLYMNNKMDRGKSVFQYMEELSDLLAGYSDASITASLPNLIGQESIPITLAVSGEDMETLDSITTRLQREISRRPLYIRPSTSVRNPRREIRVSPNRAILADAGIAPSQLGLMLRTNIEGTKTAQFKSGARSYDIRVKFQKRDGLRQVEEFQIPLPNGQSVLLPQYANIRSEPSPVMISRYDKSRMSVLYSFLHADLPLGTAMDEITEIIERGNLVPAGYGYAFLGAGEMMGETLAEFSEALLTAIFLTYLVLAAVLESFTRPFYIMTTIPMGLIGMLWALRIAGYPINMFVLLGAVLLIGIVVNNAVLVIDHMQQLASEGMNRGEAMLQAVALEFRPILMITIAAALGMLPLAIGAGLGSEMNVGIGTSSVGGIIVSGVLTLLVIPVIFLMFNPPDKDEDPDDAEMYENVKRTSSRVFHKPVEHSEEPTDASAP